MPLTDDDKARIEGRKWAEEAIEYAINEGGAYLVGFCRTLAKFQKANPQSDLPLGVMPEAQSIEFEKEVLKFGIHGEKTWGTAPAEYVGYLIERGRRLQEYARSDRFKRRQEEDSEGNQ